LEGEIDIAAKFMEDIESLKDKCSDKTLGFEREIQVGAIQWGMLTCCSIDIHQMRIRMERLLPYGS